MPAITALLTLTGPKRRRAANTGLQCITDGLTDQCIEFACKSEAKFSLAMLARVNLGKSEFANLLHERANLVQAQTKFGCDCIYNTDKRCLQIYYYHKQQTRSMLLLA